MTALGMKPLARIGLGAEVLTEDLLVAGDVDREGHRSWPCTTGEAVERITQAWLTNRKTEIPPPGALVWPGTPEGVLE